MVTPQKLVAQLLIATMLAAPLRAQSPSAQPAPQNAAPQDLGPYTLKVESDLVLVNLVVRDKQGNLVRGLTRDDFTLLEDGNAQHVASFDFVQIAGPQAVAAPAPSSPAPVLSSGAKPAAKAPVIGKDLADPSDKRLIVIFFDFSGMEVDEIERSVEAALKYVDTRMTPSDLVAVTSFGNALTLDQDFTTDKELVRKALKRYTASSGNAGLEAGGTGDAEGTGESGNAFAADDSDFNTYNTDRKLQALQSLADAMSGIRYKKSIVYFSGALTRGLDNQAQLRSTINAAIRANVSIYSVSSTGLEALPPGGGAQSASLRGTGAYSGAGMRAQFDQNFSGTETLVTLAQDTGGKAFLDTNDFGPAFDKIQEDTAAYYLIGYRSSNKLKDGRYRKITVRTTRKDVKLEFRSGYFAAKDYAHFNREDKEAQMQSELESELPQTDLSVYLAGAWFRLDDQRFFVPVSLVVPGSQVPFVKESDQDKATLDIIGQVREADSKFPVGNVRETVKLALSSGRNVARKNVQYNTAFVLAPGRYLLKFVLRENATGKLGSFEAGLTIPDLRKLPQKNAVKMSSVVLSSQIEPLAKAQKDNPLAREGRQLLINVAHVFTPEQHLYLYYEVYDPAPAQAMAQPTQRLQQTAQNPAQSAQPSASPQQPAPPAAAPPKPKHPVRVLSSVLFLNEKTKVFDTPLVEVQELSTDRKAAVFQLDIPLAKLRPGQYTCQVNVIDDASGTFTFPRFTIMVREASAPLAPSSPGRQ